VVVMHAGQTVEWGPVRAIFKSPSHPYTRALIRAVPRVDRAAAMEPIPGALPSLLAPPLGCRFAPRCALAVAECRVRRPEPHAVGPEHDVACVAAEA
jgi:oligopeptide/dipeptide ABC transporter ATP-binding protein